MRKIQVFAMAVFATLIASCSNDDEMTQTPEKDTSIRVTASVQSAATRAGYSSDNLPQTFYLTITGNGDTDYTNVSMTKGENNLYAPTDGNKLLWATTNYDGVNISAYTTDIQPKLGGQPGSQRPAGCDQKRNQQQWGNHRRQWWDKHRLQPSARQAEHQLQLQQ